MVLEELFLNIHKLPSQLFFLGLLYSSLSVLISVFFFPEQAPTFFLFFTVLFCVPLTYKIISGEEKKDELVLHEKTKLAEHVKTADFLLYLFAGIVLGYLLLFIALPDTLTKEVFKTQIDEIKQVNQNQVTGNVIKNIGLTHKIFFHNSGIIVLCLFFSLLFGSGAIFILVWNAATIATAIGLLIKPEGLQNIARILTKFSVHGIPEIGAYFLALLAGGILSIAVTHKHFATPAKYAILYDVVCLVLISFGILYGAAFLEVYVSSLI